MNLTHVMFQLTMNLYILASTDIDNDLSWLGRRPPNFSLHRATKMLRQALYGNGHEDNCVFIREHLKDLLADNFRPYLDDD